MTLKMRLMGGIVAFSMLLGGCAQGFDSDERFTNGVSNAQLEAPVLTAESFSLVLAADGSEAIQVKWPVVMGAGGYRVSVDKVAVMENGSLVSIDPIAVPLQGDQTVVEIDACQVTFPCEYGYQYAVTVQAMANKKLGNSESPLGEPARYLYYTVPTPIPAGADLAEAIVIDEENPTSRAIYVLEPGAHYTCSQEIDFQRHNVQMYPADYDAANNVYNISPVRARITFDYDGVIKTSAGLQLKNIDFDCEAMKAQGVIMCSDQIDASLAEPVKNQCYVIKDPIIMENCRFRMVKQCLFFTGACSVSPTDIRLINSMVQLDNDGTKFGNAAVFCTYSSTGYYVGGTTAWRNGIRNLTVKNSTLWNIKKNSKNRMVRFTHNNFGNYFETKDGSATFENCTMIQIMTDKEFGNNTPNDKQYVITFNNNVVRDCYRLQKFIQGNNTKNIDVATNALCKSVMPDMDSTDKTRCGTEESFTFDAAMMDETGLVNAILDLDKEDGGVNFKAIGGTIAPTVGDPRWL